MLIHRVARSTGETGEKGMGEGDDTWLMSLEVQNGFLPRKQESQTGHISPAP